MNLKPRARAPTRRLRASAPSPAPFDMLKQREILIGRHDQPYQPPEPEYGNFEDFGRRLCAFLAIVMLFCSALYYGVFVLRERLEVIKLEHAAVFERTKTLEAELIQNLTQRNAYSASLAKLSKLPDWNQFEFYSSVQQAVERSGASIFSTLSMNVREKNSHKTMMEISFTGDYYDILKALSALKNIPDMAILSSLSIIPEKIGVKAKALLEAYVR